MSQEIRPRADGVTTTFVFGAHGGSKQVGPMMVGAIEVRTEEGKIKVTLTPADVVAAQNNQETK